MSEIHRLVPSDPSVSSEAGLTVAILARRLGVAPATLRTWDRRYALGPSERTAGSHRRYSSEDIARLDVMRRLLNQGIAPQEAARIAKSQDVSAQAALVLASLVGGAEEVGDDTVVDVTPFARPFVSEPGGAEVYSISSGIASVRGVASAAMSLDNGACTGLIKDAIERRGVVWTWEHMLVPVLIDVGNRWASTGRGIAVEHVLSDSITSAFNSVCARVTSAVNARPVLLACSDEEQHALPLHAVAAALAERRIMSRNLGARVPPEVLMSAVRRTGPAAVLVWSYLPKTGDPSQLADLPAMRPVPLVLAAGPGWAPEMPQDVLRVRSLVEAVTSISNAVDA
ncbi:MAG: MerR family transcriptional regulator [Actinomycetes bacterium]